MGRKTIKRGASKRHIEGKDFQLVDEIRYIQRCAAEHDGRWVTISPLALFSTETGDATPGYSTRTITRRHGWRGTATQKTFISRKPRPGLPLAGKAHTALTLWYCLMRVPMP